MAVAACAPHTPSPADSPILTTAPVSNPTAPATKASDAHAACDQGVGWRTIAVLPAGFTGTGGAALGSCQFVVVGEWVERGTGGQAAQILKVSPGVAAVDATYDARTFWDVARGAGGELWAGGETHDGSGFLLRGVGEEWVAVPVPANAGWLHRLAWTEDRLIVSSVSSGDAILSSYSAEDGWERIATIEGQIVEGEPRREPPSLSGIAAIGADVAVAGTNGLSGVVLLSRDAGTSFQAVELPDGILDVATTAIPAPNGLIVTGYRATGTEAYVGVLLIRSEVGWHEVPLPNGVRQIRDATSVDGILFVIAEESGGEGVYTVSESTITRETLDGSDFTRFVSPSESILSVIGKELSARSVP